MKTITFCYGLFVLFLLICPSLCYKEGDYIDAERRSRVGTQEPPTKWTNLLYSQLPRFKIRKAIIWRSLLMDEIKSLGTSDFKLQLAFDQGQFETPWIKVYSYNPMLVLKQLDFVFIYRGSSIVDWKVYPEYTTVSELQEDGGNIKFMYHWDELKEEDSDNSLFFLFCFPFLFLLVVAHKVITRSQNTTTGRNSRGTFQERTIRI